VLFILLNYVTHAMTVRSEPGETRLVTAFNAFSALLLPFSGVFRGAQGLFNGARWAGNKLAIARSAGALCVVSRTEGWSPRKNEEVRGCTVRGGKKAGRLRARIEVPSKFASWEVIDLSSSHIHGQVSLPEGYVLIYVSDIHMDVEPEFPDSPINLASNLSTPKIVASLVQVTAAVLTLYHSRGTQLDTYGYAAFGLTVIPYALMSIVNLIGNLVCPSYDALYLVRSEVMDEAEARGGKFSGTVGRIVVPEDTRHDNGWVYGPDNVKFTDDASDVKGLKMYGYEDQDTFSYTEGPTIIEVPLFGPYTAARRMPMQDASSVVGLLFITITFIMPYIVIAVLTRFKPQSSTALQRGFMMAWLVVGQVSGIICYGFMEDKSKWQERGRLFAIFVVLFGAPAIGGFVMVGLMMKEFGYCVDL
jgi:hypothetical protein